MGNQPSTANSNKLSKPKTNKNSTGAAPKVESPAAISPTGPDLTTEGRQQIKEALLSPVTSELDLVPAPHQQDDVGENTTTRGRTWSMISRSNSRTNSRSNSISCFGNKHGSTAKLAGLSDPDMSLASASQVDLEAAIRLLQQVKKKASPEDLAALHEALEGPDDPAIPLSDPTLTRRTSDVNRSSSSLMRRQSLVQAPGIGTRKSPVEGRRRTWNSWKTPKIERDEEVKSKISPKGAVRLTTQATMIKAEESRDAAMPRAQTPGELDYGHLGSLRGSLRVTNGAPSPAPSANLLKSHYAEDDEYFSTTETDSSPLMMKSARNRGHTKSKSAVLPTKNPLCSEETNDVHMAQHERATQDEEAKVSSTPLQTQNPPVELESRIPIPKCLRIGSKDADASTSNAARFAQSYQAEIPLSPFFASEDTTKTDQGQNLVPDETVAFRNDTARMLEGTVFVEPEPKTLVKEFPSSSAASSQLTLQKPRGHAHIRPLPYTTDSGYSSRGSLQTVDRDQYKIVVPVTPAELSGSPPRNHGTSMSILSNSTNQPVELPTTKETTVDVYNTASETSLSSITQASSVERRSSALSSEDSSTRSSARSSISEALQSPLVPQSATPGSSLDSTSSTKQRRLQRKRPTQAGAPVVQSCQSIPEGTIPDVPVNVRAKFERRLSHSPEVECLTHTYPTNDHTTVEDPAAVDHLPVQTEFTQLAELESARPPVPPAATRRRSMSLFRRKSTVGENETGREDLPSLDVAHLGIIASSLGSSPYDAAMSRTPNKTATPGTHPHQLGSSLPRAKSMANMDSKAAVEFARAHSKDLALGEQEKSQQRRRSHHNLKIDAGEAKVSKRRPKDSDVPPVPTIDVSKLPSPLTVLPRSESESPVERKHDISFSRPRKQRQRMSEIVGKYDSQEQRPSQPSVNWEAHSQAWSQRRKSIGEGLREKEVVTANSLPADSRPRHRASEDIPSWGRYSGGLQYEYQGRGVGIGGSSGTREQHSLASAKSTHFKHSYGVDLSDVPIMVQRI